MKKRIGSRPSRVHFVFGLLIGLLFVGVGVFSIIPMFGPFGILWTFLAVFVIIVNGWNLFTVRSKSSGSTNYDAPEENESSQQPEDTEESLMDIYKQYNRHLITEEDYMQKRAELLRQYPDNPNKD